VHIPYPPGFLFPQPNLTTSFTAGAESALDPFLWLQAMSVEKPAGDAEGEMRDVIGSVGDRFSFRYSIPAKQGKRAVFEYENHSQNGSFRMHSLAWASFTNSTKSCANGHGYDTVTFSGWGVWTKDGVRSIQQVAAQISTSPDHPYLGIQIGLTEVSNVNTKPDTDEKARP
jgi:hypothetical protein